MLVRKFFALWVVALIVLVACAPPAGSLAGEPQGLGKLDDTPRLAVISAFGAELEAFKEEATIEKTVVINGRSYYLGELGGNQVVMVLSGVSMVNAAMATQTVIDHFNVERIVFSGIAGGVNPELRIGDVVVPTKWAEYQENFFVREVDGEYMPPPWFEPTLPNYGMMFPQGVDITVNGGEPDQSVEKFWYEVDPVMLGVAEDSTAGAALLKCTEDGACLEETPVIKVGGNGVAGPTFVDNASYREYVWEVWQADALDMESAAVAHVATGNGVPFIVFRSLSDLAGGGPGENEIGTFFQLAAVNSATVMTAFLSEWASR